MPSQQEIERQIQNEMNEFASQLFPTIVPQWFLEKFPGAIMTIPGASIPYHAARVQLILTKTPEQLTIFDIGLVCNVLLGVKPEYFGWEIQEYLSKRSEVEQVKAEFTDLSNKESSKVQRMRQALSNMGGQMHNGVIKNIQS